MLKNKSKNESSGQAVNKCNDDTLADAGTIAW